MLLTIIHDRCIMSHEKGSPVNLKVIVIICYLYYHICNGSELEIINLRLQGHRIHTFLQTGAIK